MSMSEIPGTSYSLSDRNAGCTSRYSGTGFSMGSPGLWATRFPYRELSVTRFPCGPALALGTRHQQPSHLSVRPPQLVPRQVLQGLQHARPVLPSAAFEASAFGGS